MERYGGKDFSQVSEWEKIELEHRCTDGHDFIEYFCENIVGSNLLQLQETKGKGQLKTLPRVKSLSVWEQHKFITMILNSPAKFSTPQIKQALDAFNDEASNSWLVYLLTELKQTLLIRSDENRARKNRRLSYKFHEKLKERRHTLCQGLKHDQNHTICGKSVWSHFCKDESYGKSFTMTQPAPLDIDTPRGMSQVERLSQSMMNESPVKKLRMDDTLLGLSQDSSQLSLSEIDVDEEKRIKMRVLLENWTTSGTPSTDTLPEINVLTECTPAEMQALCTEFNLQDLSETAVNVACHQITSLSSQLSLTNTEIFASCCLLPKVIDLQQSCSRVLLEAVTCFAKSFPGPSTSSVFVVCAKHEGFSSAQADLINRIFKEVYKFDQKQTFFRELIESDVSWNESIVDLLHPFIDDKNDLPDGATQKLISQADRWRHGLSANLKFGKLLLALVNKHYTQISKEDLTVVLQVANTLKSFLKKAIVASIKKQEK